MTSKVQLEKALLDFENKYINGSNCSTLACILYLILLPFATFILMLNRVDKSIITPDNNKLKYTIDTIFTDKLKERVQRNNGKVYYTVTSFTNRESLTQYIKVYLPDEANNLVDTTGILYESLKPISATDKHYIRLSRKDTLEVEGMDFLYIEKAMNILCEMNTKLVRIDTDILKV